MHFDALMLSRLQFAFTTAFHIIFPIFSIGLASFLAVLEGLWLATRNEAFKALYLFWLKIFAISCGMDLVTGVAISYEIGTNWSVYSAVAAPVIGPLLAFEVLAAFLLEASLLGVMLFGWGKVGPRLHFAASVLVALGALASAFWILSASGWMLHPSGYVRLANGMLRAADWGQAIFSPTFQVRLVHMVLAACLTTSLVVGAASAWRLLKVPAEEESCLALKMAIGMFAIVAPLELVAGDASAQQGLRTQPAKPAAIEAFRDTRAGQALHIAAGDTNARVEGLQAFPPQDRPPVGLAFWAFRITVGLAVAVLGLGAWGAWFCWRGGLAHARWFLRACLAMGPAGLVAVISGWVVAVSPLTPGEVSTSLVAFMAVYALIFSVGVLYILRLIHEGPAKGGVEPAPSPAS